MKNKSIKESVNGWWMTTNPYDCKEYGFTPLSEINNSYKFKVFLCPSCNRVHENAWECGTGNQLHYYKDFPTLGLQRVECDICNNGN